MEFIELTKDKLEPDESVLAYLRKTSYYYPEVKAVKYKDTLYLATYVRLYNKDYDKWYKRFCAKWDEIHIGYDECKLSLDMLNSFMLDIYGNMILGKVVTDIIHPNDEQSIDEIDNCQLSELDRLIADNNF